MQYWIVLFYKGIRRLKYSILSPFQYLITSFLFYCNNIKIGTFETTGVPFISVGLEDQCSIGSNFRMNNNIAANRIGRIQKCSFFVEKKGTLKICDNVSMSYAGLYCSRKIIIHNNVMIGGGTRIYDTDFHSLAAADCTSDRDEKIVSGAVVIEENVFIGTNCTILKGVTIDNTLLKPDLMLQKAFILMKYGQGILPNLLKHIHHNFIKSY
jgi:acetyltransferase-like isoleucine patch superfamily enzyme